MRRVNCDAGQLSALSAPKFVGRDQEFAALSGALEQAPAVVLIEGEAGIGKSRLLRVLLTQQAECGRRVLVGACPELRVPYTLGAVVDAVRDGVDEVSSLSLSGLGGALRPLFPEWSVDLPPAPEPLEDASAARHRLFRAFVEIFDRLDVAVLVLEDVHWADEATLEFLLFLVSRRPQPVSVVLTYRREEVSASSLLLRLTSRLPADAHLCRLALKPLGIGDTASVVSSMLAGEHVSAEFSSFLHARTDGVPLAVEESVRLMHDRADLIRREGGWERRRLDRIEVPPTIRDAMLERVERLGPDTRTVLYAISVLSGPADYAVLHAVTGLHEDRFTAQAPEALGCGLLRETGPGQWSFRHSLACHAVYEAIPGQQRRAMHLRAGRALESLPVPPVAQLARHFRLAGDVEASCRYTEQAADLATQTGDVATSAQLLHNVVTTLALPVESLLRLVVKIPFTSLPGSDPYSQVVESLQSALRSQPLTPDQEALVRFQIGRVLMAAGAIEAGRLEISNAVPDLPPASAEAARARNLLAMPLGDARSASEHLQWLHEAPAMLSPTIAPRERLRLSMERISVLLMLGEEAGWADVRQIPDDSADPQEAALIATSRTNVGDAAIRWGRYDEAAAQLAKAQALAERYALLGLLDGIASTQAHLDWFTGAWSGHVDRAARLIDDDMVRMQDRCEVALVAGLIQAASGDRTEAEERLRFACRDDQQRIEAVAALARLCLHDGNVDEALRLTDGPAEITVGGGIWPRATEVAPVRVAALVASGRLGHAVHLVDAFESALGGRDAPAPQASLVLCRATVAEAEGRLADASVLFAQAADSWQTLPRPYDALLAREHHGRCLLAVGGHEAGLPILSDVTRALSDLGAHHDADRVARLFKEHGRDVRATRGRGRPGYGNQLSPRELEVARLLIGGRTNREIADALVVSTQTVASQVKSAMRKLNVTSRTVLAIRVVELGLLGMHRPAPAADE